MTCNVMQFNEALYNVMQFYLMLCNVMYVYMYVMHVMHVVYVMCVMHWIVKCSDVINACTDFTVCV